MSEDECLGSGRRWGFGTGMPMCPVCHRGLVALTGIRPKGVYKSALRGAPEVVPSHPRRLN